MEALGECHSSFSSRKEISSTPAFLYAQDALYCSRRYFNDWEKNPDAMEELALSSPLQSIKVTYDFTILTSSISDHSHTISVQGGGFTLAACMADTLGVGWLWPK